MRNTNEMEIRFDGKSANEGFARVAVVPLLNYHTSSGGGEGVVKNTRSYGVGSTDNLPG